MAGAEKDKKAGTPEEFLTDAQLDFNASFEDALLLGKFDVAQSQLDDFKNSNGETASYLYRLGRLKEKHGQLQAAYDLFKQLYFEWPVYMHDKYDYERLRQDVIQTQLNKSRALWNQLVAKASRFIEENPEANGRDIKEPYAKAFWAKQKEELQEVAKSFAEVLAFEKNEVAAISALIQCNIELGNKEYHTYYQECFAEAKKFWKEMTEKRSLSALAAAKKHGDGGRYDAAIEVVNLGLETDPLNVELLLVKAEALQKLHHLKEAQSCVIAVLRLNQSNSKAIRLKKSIDGHIFDLNVSEGMAFLYQAEQEKPGSSAQLTRVESALKHFLDALAFNNQSLSVLAGVYRCHIRSGEPLKAQKTLDRIQEIDSKFDVYSIFREKSDDEGKKDLCFVATRVYGETHPNTVLLRKLRDQHLRYSLPGRIFIALYRRIGPAMAAMPEGSLFLRICRITITAAVWLLVFLHYAGSKCQFD